MKRSEIDIGIDWAEAEGWNPGIHDADCFYAADPDGFFIGLLKDEPAAMVSAVAYGDSYGFMGFYIVKPEFRNRNYGVLLWNEGLQHLKNRCIGLDSVRPDLVSHNKPEFKPAYTNYRFKWIKDEQSAVAPEVVDLSSVPFSIVAAYDCEVFGLSRESFLKCWINQPDSRALGIITLDKLSGYGVIRKCREGFKIGPLFSDSVEHAKALFEALVSDVKMGSQIFLDTPEKNPEAVSIAQGYDMTEVFQTTRMYKGQEPALPLNKWFGVTSFELG
jgi:GNAT superfamily N-acetyltransferase